MATSPECEAAAVRAVEQEGIGTVIELRVAIGRGQQHQNDITRVQAYPVDFARRGDKASSVLYRRVESLDLGEQIVDAWCVAL
ncbi:hypothetical protein D3C86_1228190 [compost metagenome]